MLLPLITGELFDGTIACMNCTALVRIPPETHRVQSSNRQFVFHRFGQKSLPCPGITGNTIHIFAHRSRCEPRSCNRKAMCLIQALVGTLVQADKLPIILAGTFMRHFPNHQK